MAKFDIFEIVKKDESLKEYTNNLNDNELEVNILTLFKQHQMNEICAKCMGKTECLLDPKEMQAYLVKDGIYFRQHYKECKFKRYDFKTLYMPEFDIEGDLFVNEKRANIFNEIKNVKEGSNKGIYLYGSFGSGKTYLMMKLAKELSKTKDVLFVYYPELINKIKVAMFKNDSSYDYTLEMMKHVDILFLDDVGREQNTAFNRDQVLGTILQYRYMNNLKTFMTSNYDINMLREHFRETKNSIDTLNSDGVIERILAMMNVIGLEDKNYR